MADGDAEFDEGALGAGVISTGAGLWLEIPPLSEFWACSWGAQ
jgi:hypothetical protein